MCLLLQSLETGGVYGGLRTQIRHAHAVAGTFYPCGLSGKHRSMPASAQVPEGAASIGLLWVSTKLGDHIMSNSSGPVNAKQASSATHCATYL